MELLARLSAEADRLRRPVSWVVRDVLERAVFPREVPETPVAERGRKVMAAIDLLETHDVLVRSVPKRVLGVVTSVDGVPEPPKCPKCQCSEVMHKGGANQDRCERHSGCRWTP